MCEIDIPLVMHFDVLEGDKFLLSQTVQSVMMTRISTHYCSKCLNSFHRKHPCIYLNQRKLVA